MLLDTRSNNNVAFAGISKRMGRHIFIDGKKDICKILITNFSNVFLVSILECITYVL